MDDAEAAAKRAERNKEIDELLERGLKNYQPPFGPDASEEEILAEAIRLTRRR